MTAALPTSLPLVCHLSLRAVDLSRNVDRRYEIETSVDLFGFHVVDMSWGRTGTVGQTIRRVYSSSAAANRQIVMLLRRRSQAPKRIGVAYEVVDLV